MSTGKRRPGVQKCARYMDQPTGADTVEFEAHSGDVRRRQNKAAYGQSGNEYGAQSATNHVHYFSNPLHSTRFDLHTLTLPAHSQCVPADFQAHFLVRTAAHVSWRPPGTTAPDLRSCYSPTDLHWRATGHYC